MSRRTEHVAARRISDPIPDAFEKIAPDLMSQALRRQNSAVNACLHALFVVAFVGAPSAFGDDRPWDDHSRSHAERAQMALSEMTQDEKLSLVQGEIGAPWGDQPKPKTAIGSAGFVPGIPRLGIPPLQETDAELGVANPGNIRSGDTATAMPSNLALASTWRVELARRQGESVGAEARAKGFSVLLGGAANLIRDARGGRNFEYFSEDPLLSGLMAGNAIAGVESRHLISTIKHFALNDQETNRHRLNVRIDRAAARESDLLAFEIAIEQGRPGSVMCAFNQVNDAFSCENSWLLDQVLKTDWAYSGFVMSDWGAAHSTIAAAKAGLDQESAHQIDRSDFFGAPLARAVAGGDIPQSRLDDMARRILTSIFAAGLYDDPPAPSSVDLAASDRTALEIARRGIVLLRNTGILPLSAKTTRLAAIGAHADRGVLSGGGSSQVAPRGGTAAKERSSLIDGDLIFDPSSPVEALRSLLPQTKIEYDDGTDPARAARFAADADAAIVFADQWLSEGVDAPSLALPGDQDRLIEAVADANPHTIVVLETGGPVLMPWLNRTQALMEAWYPGQHGGQAIAEALCGTINPSGRLPVTFPLNEAQTPRPRSSDRQEAERRAPVEKSDDAATVSVDYSEGSAVGYKWFARRKDRPLFPFGFGLSYTEFKLSDLAVSVDDEIAKVDVTVQNIGARSGVATPQFYLSGQSVSAPLRLAGWTSVELRPGEKERSTTFVDPRLFARFDEPARRWRIDAGAYNVSAGFDSESLQETVSVRLGPSSMQP
jgi:beta-glucosidase